VMGLMKKPPGCKLGDVRQVSPGVGRVSPTVDAEKY